MILGAAYGALFIDLIGSFLPFTMAIDATVWAYETVAAGFAGIAPQLQDLFSVAYVVYEFIRDAGLPVHLALLLVTVGLNYALTRMVLNYQRRQ